MSDGCIVSDTTELIPQSLAILQLYACFFSLVNAVRTALDFLLLVTAAL